MRLQKWTAHSAVATRHSGFVINSSFVIFPMIPVQIKICGITNTTDARACAELGAQLIGLNFYPQSPRYIKPSVGREIVESLPAETEAVGVFVDGNAEEIRETEIGRASCRERG